jgi:hypothetical protein
MLSRVFFWGVIRALQSMLFPPTFSSPLINEDLRVRPQLAFTLDNRFFRHQACYSLLPAMPGYMSCQAKRLGTVCWSVETTLRKHFPGLGLLHILYINAIKNWTFSMCNDFIHYCKSYVTNRCCRKDILSTIFAAKLFFK